MAILAFTLQSSTVEICGALWIYISNSWERIVQENGCGPAPVKVHLKALRHIQRCSWPGQLCPWASAELRRKQNYCRGRKPWDGVPPLPPVPSTLQRVTGISHLLIAKLPNSLSLGLRPAWKGCRVPEGTAPCADGLALQQDTARAEAKCEKAWAERRSPYSALVHSRLVAALRRKWGIKWFCEQRHIFRVFHLVALSSAF